MRSSATKYHLGDRHCEAFYNKTSSRRTTARKCVYIVIIRLALRETEQLLT